jgi:hypothetical protein
MKKHAALSVVALIAIGIATTRVIAGFTAPATGPEVSIPSTKAPYNEPFLYFPAQYFNQATEIEPAPPTF